MAGPARKLLGVDFTLHGSSQLHELGLKVIGSDGREYTYVHAGAAIALGDCLKLDPAEGTWEFQPTAAADEVIVGAWPNEGGRTAILDNEYFWALTGGDALVKAAATVVAGAPAITIATAGTVDDTAATAANALAAGAGLGAVFLTATSGGFARVMFK